MPTKHYRVETYSTTDNVGTIFVAYTKVIGIICKNNKTKKIIIINVRVPSPTNRFIIFVDVNVL